MFILYCIYIQYIVNEFSLSNTINLVPNIEIDNSMNFVPWYKLYVEKEDIDGTKLVFQFNNDIKWIAIDVALFKIYTHIKENCKVPSEFYYEHCTIVDCYNHIIITRNNVEIDMCNFKNVTYFYCILKLTKYNYKDIHIISPKKYYIKDAQIYEITKSDECNIISQRSFFITLKDAEQIVQIHTSKTDDINFSLDRIENYKIFKYAFLICLFFGIICIFLSMVVDNLLLLKNYIL